MLYHVLCNERSCLLQIDNIGTSSDSAICRFGPGRRELFLIHYVLAGCGSFNGQALRAGQGFLITPGSSEQYAPSEEEPWSLLWVTSRDPRMGELFKTYQADPDTQVFSYRYVAAANELAVRLRREHGKFYAASEILELFLNLYNNREKSAEHRESASELYVRCARSIVQTNLFRRLSVEELADSLGVSQPYLYRIFLQHCGCSPKQYIDKQKLQKACILLQKTEMPITEIACSVGFDDPLAFSAFFKRSVGVSPSRYREAHQ